MVLRKSTKDILLENYEKQENEVAQCYIKPNKYEGLLVNGTVQVKQDDTVLIQDSSGRSVILGSFEELHMVVNNLHSALENNNRHRTPVEVDIQRLLDLIYLADTSSDSEFLLARCHDFLLREYSAKNPEYIINIIRDKGYVKSDESSKESLAQIHELIKSHSNIEKSK